MAAQIVPAFSPSSTMPPAPPVFPVAPPDFVHAFNRAVGQLDLSDGAARLLELLLSYDLPDPRNGKERKGFVWPSRATLAENLNVSERTISKRMSELRNAGIIEVLDATAVAHLRGQGYDVPGPGRGQVWALHYDQLPDFQFSGEGSFIPGGKGVSPQGRRTVPPSLYTRSGKPNGPNQHHQEDKDVATGSAVPPGGDGDVSPPSSPEPEVTEPSIEETQELRKALLGWKVSKPIADRFVGSVASETIQWALRLLERNQALPRDKRIIRNPAAWACYTLTIQDDPNLTEWETRITAMEEENIAPVPTSRTIMIPELAPQEPKVAPAAPEPVEDDNSEEVAQLIEASFTEAEAQAPSFDVAVGTEDTPGTVASVEAGKKQVEIRYGQSPEAPEGDIIIDERTMPDPEPSVPSEELPSPAEGVKIGIVPEMAQGAAEEPDEAACARLWRQVQAQLEAEQQGSPFLENVRLQWDRDGVVLHAPGQAVAWALENRAGQIREVLRRLTGQSLGVEVWRGLGKEREMGGGI